MTTARRFRQLPSPGKAIGFELQTPSNVDVQTNERGDTLVRCRQDDAGKPVGELEVATFQAPLVIDRDGVLEQKASTAADDAAGAGARVSAPVPIELPGASGYRADVAPARPGASVQLPYVQVFAVASNDYGVQGGLIVTVRSAAPEWPAADAILQSLKILGRRSRTAND